MKIDKSRFLELTCIPEENILCSAGTETTEEYTNEEYNPTTEWETQFGAKYGKGSELPEPLRKKGTAACKLTLDEYAKFSGCCPKGVCYERIPYDEVMQCRRTYWGMSHDKRWSFIALNVEVQSADKVRHEMRISLWKFIHIFTQTLYVVAKKQVCLNAFISVYNISSSAFYDIRSKILKKHSSSATYKHGNTSLSNTKVRSSKGSRMVAWFRQYALDTAERLPHLRVLSN